MRWWRAMASIAMKPTLWRLRAYCGPGLPSPTRSCIDVAGLLLVATSRCRRRRRSWRGARGARGSRRDGSGGSGCSSSGGFGGGFHLFRVTGRRHDGHQSGVDVHEGTHILGQLDVAEMLGVIDLKSGHIDLEGLRNGIGRAADVERM